MRWNSLPTAGFPPGAMPVMPSSVSIHRTDPPGDVLAYHAVGVTDGAIHLHLILLYSVSGDFHDLVVSFPVWILRKGDREGLPDGLASASVGVSAFGLSGDASDSFGFFLIRRRYFVESGTRATTEGTRSATWRDSVDFGFFEFFAIDLDA